LIYCAEFIFLFAIGLLLFILYRRRASCYPLSAALPPLSPKGESKGLYQRQNLKIQTISDSPLRNRRSLPERGKQENRGFSIGRNKLRPLIEKFGGNFQSKMGYAPHHLAPQGASPQGEALTKARIALFAEENFVSKILCRQEGKP